MDKEYKLELTCKIGEIFMTYGARSVNMDDIARHLSISKKTLYKYYKDKNDIVKEVITFHMNAEQAMVEQFAQNSENAIDEIIQISQFANEMLKKMHPSVMFDLQKYYPEAFKLFTNHKEVFIKTCILKNLERGIEEGLYRDNISPYIVTNLYVSIIETIWNTDVFPPSKYSFAQVHLELIRYHVRGVASPKGIEYLTERISKEFINL